MAAAYSASKAALSSWLRAAGIELKKHGIAVTAIHPGFIKSELVPEMEKYPFIIDAEPAAKLQIGIALDAGSKDHGKLTIRFGRHRLQAPVTLRL